MADRTDRGQAIALSVPTEFSFTENLNYLTRSPNECMYRIHERRIVKALPMGREATVIDICGEPGTGLTIRFQGHDVHASVQAAAERYVSEWFDLGTDLKPFYEMAERDSVLQRTVRAFYGLRIMGIPDLFEAICWGIIGQQINLPFAYTLKKRFVESFGRAVASTFGDVWLFPTPQEIASLKPEQLTPLQLNTRKAEYLIGVARLIADGELTKDKLLDAGGLREAEKRLLAIRGVGPWTAHYVLMRCLRYRAAFPVDDVGLHNALRYVLGTDRKPTKEEIYKLAEGWTGWESYAVFYLWRLLY